MAANTANQQTQNTESYHDIAAAHIRSLSALNARIPSILTTSATTFSQLTNNPIPPSSTDPAAAAHDSISQRRSAISTTANTFFTSVLELAAALHEQIDDLEKNGVIPAEEVKYRAPAQPQHQQQGPPGGGRPGEKPPPPPPKDTEASVTNGGLGDFDVGVLNARAGVRQRDGEVLGRVKRVLEELGKHMEDEEEEEVVVVVDG